MFVRGKAGVITSGTSLRGVTHCATGFLSDRGDVNNDGSVTIVDALMTAQDYVGLNPANFDLGNADVNCDGSVTIVDAVMITQY